MKNHPPPPNMPRDIAWYLAYLTAIHAMLPIDREITVDASRIPEDAKAIANQAVEHYDEFCNKGESDARRK